MKKVVVAFSFLILCATAIGQTKEELNEQIAPKQAEIGKLQAEVDALKAQIDALPGWRKGAFGTIGGNISQFDQWFNQATPNVSSGNIGINVNAFANLKREKDFWKNALNANLGWIKFDDEDDSTDSDSFEQNVDVFNISSLYGRNITKKVAYSVLGEYRTTILDDFNDPGYLDIGVGVTLFPIDNLTVVIHPLNYNFVFADEDAIFESSLGAKILIDYSRRIGAINFKTNLTAFQSYDTSDLSNWTWTNAFSYTLWKKIGVGFEFGLRDSPQETLLYTQTVEDPGASFDSIDTEIQSYYTAGLSYAF